jgi:hypothetical protein
MRPKSQRTSSNKKALAAFLWLENFLKGFGG